MSVRRVPGSVRQQLGDEATFGLIELLDSEQKDWSDRMLTMTADRFERRLTEQVGLLRQDIADARVEMLRWSFVFWIGQVAAVAALLAFMLRATGR
jgi:hypothetical protein